MRWKICLVGKPSLSFARDGMEEYLKRLSRYTKVSVEHVREGGRDANSAQLLRLSEGALRIALDERGSAIRTRDWVKKIDQWEMDGGIKEVCLLIGGADGHNAELREKADQTWSLSALTLQHELALVVLLEGLYRCYTIKRGEPYHRD